MGFASFTELFFGFLSGIVFGFLARKAYLTRFNVIVGQLLFKDFTVMKVIFTAIVVGSIGIYISLQIGWLEKLDVSDYSMAATALGGIIFGIGMALLGYCPTTGIAALADGARDMIFGLLGIISGIFLYSFAYPWINKHIILIHSEGTLPEVIQLSPWIFIGILAVFAFGFFYYLETKEK
ncbi:MAG: YeeE/YedE family protein [Chlamydiae bacterium]|nr:YeeE/YedE family protein [Chlamydiota bacterium]